MLRRIIEVSVEGTSRQGLLEETTQVLRPPPFWLVLCGLFRVRYLGPSWSFSKWKIIFHSSFLPFFLSLTQNN